jgi:hypothetical protein
MSYLFLGNDGIKVRIHCPEVQVLSGMHWFFSYMLGKSLLLQDDLDKNRHTSYALTVVAFLLIGLQGFFEIF